MLFNLSSAQAEGGNVIARHLKRLVPKRLWSNNNSSSDNNNNDVCGISVPDDVYQLYTTSRGGYRDDTGVATASETIGIKTKKHHIRLDEEAKNKTYGKLEFPLFQKHDGSDEDPDGIPTRYLKMQLHRREHAKTALLATLAWRKEHKIDSILARPHPDFDICKAVFPHYFIGRDKENHIVFVQRPSLLDLDLAKSNNLDKEALLSTYACWLFCVHELCDYSCSHAMIAILRIFPSPLL